MESPLAPNRDAAAENFESFRQLFDQSPLGVAFVDLDYGFLKVNPALCRMFGYTAEETLRLNGTDLVHPDDLESVLENVGRLASGKIDHHQIEGRYVRKDGQAVLGRLTVCGIRDSGGQLVGFLAMMEDIAEQRRAEEELRNQEMLLRSLADERVRQHEAELAHVSRLSTMGELAAGLAHELHQPLHAINNYACGSMLRMDQTGRQDDELRTALTRISSEATRAAEIIRRLHAFVRKRQPRRQPFSLLAVLDDAVFLVADEARRRKCRVAVERPATLPEIVGDAIQIEQVLLNLIRNAFDAMEATPSERRIVHIGVRLSDEGLIVVEVRDHGCGIPTDDPTQIFKPFYTTKAEGLGMGLSISRSILHTHGGDLRAVAHAEGGTSFCLALPVARHD